MRILLTGATGFVGRHCIAPLLRSGASVHAVTSRRAGPQLSGVTWHRADLLKPSQVARLLGMVEPTHLLHLAWYTEHGAYWESPENLRWEDASIRLITAFAEGGGQRAVVAGTCAEYAWGDDTVCDEWNTLLDPSSLYGQCKKAAFEAARSLAMDRGLSLAWGRLFFVYGPAEPPRRFVPTVVRSLLAGRPALCSHGRQQRDLLFVEDAGEAFAALLASGVVGPVNVAAGVGVTLGEVAGRIGAMVGRPELVRLGAIEPAAGDPGRLLAATHRLNEEVGWRPSVDLDTGLSRTVGWWRDRPMGPAPEEA